MTELQAPTKGKRPAMACVLSEREANLLEQHGILPGHCGRHGHRHTRHSKATLLVRSRRYRWVYPAQKQQRKGHTQFLTEVNPKSWGNVLGATGFVTQQMVDGGLRV